jgi:rubrerythrin
MTEDRLLFLYAFCLLAGIAAVAVMDELRRRRFGPSSAPDNVFRCEQCRYVYTDDSDVDLSRCPQCGRMNHLFRF